MAGRADEVVHAERDELQRAARDDHRHEVERERQDGIVGARVAQDGLEREERDDPQHHGGDEQQDEAVPHHALGHVLPALPQLDGRQRVAAHAHEHGHRDHGRHHGVRHRRGRQAVGPHRVPHVHRVDDVVQHLHEHAHHGRDGELQQQLERALRAQAVDLLVALRREGAVRALFGSVHVSLRSIRARACGPPRGGPQRADRRAGRMLDGFPGCPGRRARRRSNPRGARRSARLGSSRASTSIRDQAADHNPETVLTRRRTPAPGPPAGCRRR